MAFSEVGSVTSVGSPRALTTASLSVLDDPIREQDAIKDFLLTSAILEGPGSTASARTLASKLVLDKKYNLVTLQHALLNGDLEDPTTGYVDLIEFPIDVTAFPHALEATKSWIESENRQQNRTFTSYAFPPSAPQSVVSSATGGGGGGGGGRFGGWRDKVRSRSGTVVSGGVGKPTAEVVAAAAAAAATAADQAKAPENGVGSNSSSKSKEKIWMHEKALARLENKAKFLTAPLSNASSFLEWSRMTAHSKFHAKIANNEFQAQTEKRDLRKLHAVELARVESACKKAQEALKVSSPLRQLEGTSRKGGGGGASGGGGGGVLDELKDIDTRILGCKRGIDGLQAFLAHQTNEQQQEPHTQTSLPLAKSQQTLHELQDTMRRLHERKEELTGSPLYLAFAAKVSERDQVYERIGLREAKSKIILVQAANGAKSRVGGQLFEDRCAEVLEKHVLPPLSKQQKELALVQAEGGGGGRGGEGGGKVEGVEDGEVFLLRNVMMGMGNSKKGVTCEIDAFVCVRSPSMRKIYSRLLYLEPDAVCVSVLACVEAKSNPDDVGGAFLAYQSTLNWLTGMRHTYDGNNWKNSTYGSGHFSDRPYVHSDPTGEKFLITPESFRGIAEARQIVRVEAHIADAFKKYCPSAFLPNDAKDCAEVGGAVEGAEVPLHLFVKGLLLVTKDREIENINSSAAGLATVYIASDERLGPRSLVDNAEALEDIRAKIASRMPHTISTLDAVHIIRASASSSSVTSLPSCFGGLVVLGFEENASKTEIDCTSDVFCTRAFESCFIA